MATFDDNTLRQLGEVREVAIRTEKHPKNAVVIWVVVADNAVFVRSWLGNKGRWYQDLVADSPATLEFGGYRLAVRATPELDPNAVATASREFLAKYRASTHAQEMVRSEILPTTLRLEPR